MSARQYKRKFSLIAGDAGTEGLEFADFRLTFKVRRGDFLTPNSADIRIYNVNARTANRLENEFTRVALQAGYEGNFGLIFEGTIKQSRVGRVDAKDSYVDIVAADGDRAYNFSTVSQSIAAGAKPRDAIDVFVQSMARMGVSEGYVPELTENGSVRGVVYYGMVRDELRDWAEQNDCLWSIQDGKLQFVPVTSFVPGEIPVISAQTGLIGVPEQTQNGIQVRTLLNPAIKIGHRIRLDGTVNSFRFPLDVQSQASNEAAALSNKQNWDGLYYVMSADHIGDTRDNDWYSDLTCLAVDATVPADLAPRAAIAPEAASIRRD